FIVKRFRFFVRRFTQPSEGTTKSKLTGKGFIGFTQHSAEQSFAEAPSEKVLMSFSFSTQSIGKQ
ncbi:hypothetical protein BCS63_022705, partial [Vibrio cyclitrophicus]